MGVVPELPDEKLHAGRGYGQPIRRGAHAQARLYLAAHGHGPAGRIQPLDIPERHRDRKPGGGCHVVYRQRQVGRERKAIDRPAARRSINGERTNRTGSVPAGFFAAMVRPGRTFPRQRPLSEQVARSSIHPV